MEGYTGEDSSDDSKENVKDKKVSKAAGLGSRTFEFAKKTDAAEKIAETSSIWERLIPKEKPDASELAKAQPEATKSKNDSGVESSAEEAEDPSIENLSETEKAEVAKEYAQEKRAELEAGRNDTEDPVEAAAREADIEYLEQVEKVGVVPLEAGEAAPGVAESAEAPSDDGVETAAEDIATEVDSPAELAHDEAIELNKSEVDSTPDGTTDRSDAEPPSQPLASTGTPNQPPSSPTLPPSPTFGGGSYSASFNAMPLSTGGPNTLSYAQEQGGRSNEGAYFLAGGILGYLLGRRRGRIKTEKRLKAVSKKLEKQINDTREQIKRQELVIREDARRRFNESHTARGAETTAARAIGNTPHAETITDLTRPELKQPTPEQTAGAEQVQHMQQHEVLALAEKISIDGTSLRKIYEAKQITEPGLRRITREYLRGGNIKAALQQEVAVKEMQFERDPQMRDRLAASYADVDAASPQAAKEALATLLAQNHQTTPQISTHHQQQDSESENAKSKGKQLLISAWVVLVVVLVVVAVVLATR